MKKNSTKTKLDYSMPMDRKKEEMPIPSVDVDSMVVERATTTYWSRITDFFSGMLSHPLTEQELAPFLETCKQRLIERNVAVSVAEEIVLSVKGTLIGKTIVSMSSVQTVVENAFRQVLTTILTPTHDINLLYAIANRKGNDPYSIVFCGVNGVGKSTNLAKIAAYLVQQNLKVMLVACDTFRSGAIEQLRVHANRLNAPLFSAGYVKEPADVAAMAMKEATRQEIDVLLIDTSGRMQDNIPLMKALSLLILRNSPDLILFVGEALVGNDGIDQLTKFKRAIEEGTSGRNTINGIVLSKFDTVDERMGAAVSMTRLTGKPILFVGTGQTYSDLKRLSVDTVVNSLLS